MRKPHMPRLPEDQPGGAERAGAEPAGAQTGRAHRRRNSGTDTTVPVVRRRYGVGRADAADKRATSEPEATGAPISPTDPSHWGGGIVLSRPELPDLSSRRAPADLDARKAEQRAHRNHARIRRMSLVLGGVVLAVAAAWAVFFSPLTAVRAENLNVAGVASDSTVSHEDVTNVLSTAVGTPLLRVNTGALAKQVEEHYPQLRDVRVSRAPLHGLTVTAALRTPIGCVEKGSSCVAVDASGTTFPVTKDVAGGLTHIKVTGSKANMTTLLDVLASLKADVRAEVESVTILENSRIQLNLSKGRSVVWGDASNADLKAQVLRVLLTQTTGTVFDVSEPTAPFVK